MKQLYCKITALLLALCMLAGCAGDTAGESGTAEEPVQETIEAAQPEGEALGTAYMADDVFSLNAILDSSFHPYRLTSAWNRVVDMLVYEPMVVIDGSFEAQPGLITSWETEDGITWTFTVDTTRSFHSGAPVTAVDCAYTLQLAKTENSYKERFAAVQDITTLSNSSFQVRLSSANRRFYALLNVPCVEAGTFYDSIPSGTGPYKFAATGDMLVLSSSHPKADSMPLLRIYLKEYTASSDILQAFESSYIDLVVNDPNSLSNLGYSKTNIIRYVDSTNMHYLGYNMQSMVMSQTAIRAAMTYIIDRSSIVSLYMSGAGVPATLPIHPYNSLYPQELAQSLGYAPEKFSEALDSLGMVDADGDGLADMFAGVAGVSQGLDFIVCADSSSKVSAARRIANEMTKAGLAVTLRELSYADYTEALKDGDFDLYYAEIKIRPDWDISTLFRADWSADDSLNFSRSSDSTLLSSYAQFMSAAPEGEQAALDSLFGYMAQAAPITVICFEKSEVLYHRGVISGMDPTQDNIFNGMEQWTIDLSAGQTDAGTDTETNTDTE